MPRNTLTSCGANNPNQSVVAISPIVHGIKEGVGLGKAMIDGIQYGIHIQRTTVISVSSNGIPRQPGQCQEDGRQWLWIHHHR